MRRALILFTLALVGCQGASIEGGEIDGTEFRPLSAVNVEVDNNIHLIFITTHPNPCARFQESDARVAGIDSLSLVLSNPQVDGFSFDFEPIEPGTFKVREDFGDFEGPGVSATYEDTDDDCDRLEILGADEGEVELTSFEDDGGAAGSFELEFDGEDYRGSFNAGFCDIDPDDFGRDNGDCDP